VLRCGGGDGDGDGDGGEKLLGVWVKQWGKKQNSPTPNQQNFFSLSHCFTHPLPEPAKRNETQTQTQTKPTH